MRDIRGDLQDRASLLEEQISAKEAQFETLVKQIKAEHEARREDLRAEFDAVTKLLELEHRRRGNTTSADHVRAGHTPGRPSAPSSERRPTGGPSSASRRSSANAAACIPA